MAKQSGIIPIKGTIGNLTFYKGKEGYLVREKGGVTGERIANDPAFQRTRENGQEFGRAGKAGKLLRTSVRALTQNASDPKMVSRLTKEFMRVIKADATNDRGLRNVIDGEAELLEGFEFNLDGKLGTTLYAPYTATIDRVTGVLQVVIDAFVPTNMINAGGGSTHFKINSAGAAVDFEGNVYTVEVNSSAVLPWNNVATATLTLTNTVPANSTQPLFLLLGIEFYQEVNGTMYPLKNGAFNPLAIVKVSGV